LLEWHSNAFAVIFKLAFFTITLGLAFNAFSFEVSASNGLSADIKQVKTADSAAVYYLDHGRGLKKAYVSASAYMSYGNHWSDIRIVSSEELDLWKDAELIKTTGNAGVYYIRDGKKALIRSESEFIGLGFDWSDVITLSLADFNFYKETSLAELYNSSGQITVDGKSEKDYSGLGVYLDSASPKESYAVVNTKDNLAAVFNLISRSEKTIVIKSIAFDLKGAHSDDLIKDIYLANSAGVKYEDFGANRTGRKVTFNFRPAGLSLAPGEVKKILVYIDLGGSKTNEGQDFQVLMENSGYVSADAPVAGRFPLISARQKILVGDGVLGKLRADELSLNGYNKRAIIGSTEQPIIKFSLSELTKNEDLAVKLITLTSKGSARPEMIKNFKLKNSSGKIIAQAAALSGDNKLYFNVSNYAIAKDSKETFLVTADIIDGEEKTFNFNLLEIKVIGKNTGLGLPADIYSLDESQTIKREYIGVASKDLKTNTKVFSQQKGVIVGNFEIRNNNKKITLQSFEFELQKNSSAPRIEATVYLVNYATGEIYGHVEGTALSAGPAVINMVPVALEAKKNLTITLITDIPKNTSAGDYYMAVLRKINYSAENGAHYSDAIKAPGAKLNVTSSGLYVYPNHETEGLTYIKGEGGVTVANFILEASAGEDIVINGLTVAQGDSSGAITYDNGFSGLRAYINGKRVGQIIYEPTGATFAISGFNQVLKNGSRVKLIIVADTVRDLRVSETRMVLSEIVAVGYKSGIPAQAAGLPCQSLPVFFDITALDIISVNGGTAIFDTDNNLTASFNIANLGIEDIRLKQIEVTTDAAGFTSSLGFFNLRIAERASGRKLGNISRPVAGANILSLGNITIKPGEELFFDVYVDTDNRVPAGSFQVYFNNLIAEGAVSRLSPDITGDPTDPVTVTVN